MTADLVKRLRELLQPDMCNITPRVYTAIAVAAGAIGAETRRADAAEARVRELESEHGEPPHGSRLWRCECELRKARALIEKMQAFDVDTWFALASDKMKLDPELGFADALRAVANEMAVDRDAEK